MAKSSLHVSKIFKRYNTPIIFIGITVLLIFILRNNQQVRINTSDPEQALTSLEKSLKVSAPIATRNIDWIDQNNQRIPLMGESFVLGVESNAYMGKYGNYIQYQYPNANGFLSDVTEDSLKPLLTGVDNFFLGNGFLKDNKNTFDNIIGYAKGDLKCLTSVVPHGDPLGDFFCGTIDQTQIAWRKELRPAINGNNDPNVVFTVNKFLGNYATGVVGSTKGGGGSVWYAVKINGVWEKVWEGQNVISCNPVNQYNIPKEIYGKDCSPNY